MRGFITGTLTLVFLETLTRHANVDKASAGLGLLAQIMRRAMAADVAGIPKLNKPAPAPAAATPAPATPAPPGTKAPELKNPYLLET